jgi:hypothetical protein
MRTFLNINELIYVTVLLIGTGTLPPGTDACLRKFTPVCTLNKTATNTTCDTMAVRWNITKEVFVSYNNDVNNNCTDLIIGKPVRVLCDCETNTRA